MDVASLPDCNILMGAWHAAPEQLDARPSVPPYCPHAVQAMGPDYPETTFRLYLMAAQAANVCGFSNITYEFTTQAYYLYETAIADTQEQIDAITLMVPWHVVCRMSTLPHPHLAHKSNLSVLKVIGAGITVHLAMTPHKG